MKVTTVIDADREEEVVIYATRRSELVEQIERLVAGNPLELLGFQEDVAVPLSWDDVAFFRLEEGKLYAAVGRERYRIRGRLYQVEQQAPSDFIKLHQACLANVRHIARFETAFSGTLRVVFKNGDADYVSRRQIKHVKERLGL